ncbi:hypothetical protein NDU88_008168 [Pleurodeles waltl]|uniref:Uncharacterized protein n=1 Tax=Pleurodeles waltl TaxID=8319 RepID=A0AAV7SUG5_PLEWA|nr:hypothetical protein NDU88_008168 [Pleurodeles waltl]
MNQTTGTSDAASQERGGPQIPRVRKQAIALGVMVAVTTFINIVLYRLESQELLKGPEGAAVASDDDDGDNGYDDSEDGDDIDDDCDDDDY